MTTEEILKEAIGKAIKNGMVNDIPHSMFSFEFQTWNWHNIIFSHDFAKAFWGENKKTFELEDINDGTDNFYGFGGKLIYSYSEGGTIRYRGEIWKYHLQQMVLEADPIKYLAKFL